MEVVFLKDGQKCLLHGKVGDDYIVEQYLIYNGYDEESDYEALSGVKIFVKEIFKSEPVDVISSEIISLEEKKSTLLDEIKILKNDKAKADYELSKISKTLLNEKSFVINKNELINAKSIALFPRDRIEPLIMKSDDKSFRGLKMSTEFSITDKEERNWGYKLYYDYNDIYSQFLCPKHGFIINPTDEDILKIVHIRQKEKEFNDWDIERTNIKWLIPENIERKKMIEARKRLEEITKIKSDIKAMEEKLKDLRNKMDI